MYIPITLLGPFCAQQFFYGFNILNKLEDCTLENQNPYGNLDFLNLGHKSIGIENRYVDFLQFFEQYFEIF